MRTLNVRRLKYVLVIGLVTVGLVLCTRYLIARPLAYRHLTRARQGAKGAAAADAVKDNNHRSPVGEQTDSSLSEPLKIVLTAFATICVLVIGSFLTRIVIDPITELSKATGRTAYTMHFYANAYSNPGTGTREAMDLAAEELRRQASLLLATCCTVRAYRLWAMLGLIPMYSDVLDAVGAMVGLSNSIHRGNAMNNAVRAEKVWRHLRIWRHIGKHL